MGARRRSAVSALLLQRSSSVRSQGPIFPVSTGVFVTWFTPRQWPLVQGLQSMALGLGAALAPPLDRTADGRASTGSGALIWTTLPGLGRRHLVGVWYGRNTPKEHAGVSEAELAETGRAAAALSAPRLTWPRVGGLLQQQRSAAADRLVPVPQLRLLPARQLVLPLLSAGATLPGILESGWLAVRARSRRRARRRHRRSPRRRACQALGVHRGLRLLPLLSLPAAGRLQFLAVDAMNAYLAVAAIALCFVCVELNEGPYWTAIMYVGDEDTMAAGGC